jgi:hypothetical protein
MHINGSLRTWRQRQSPTPEGAVSEHWGNIDEIRGEEYVAVNHERQEDGNIRDDLRRRIRMDSSFSQSRKAQEDETVLPSAIAEEGVLFIISTKYYTIEYRIHDGWNTHSLSSRSRSSSRRRSSLAHGRQPFAKLHATFHFITDFRNWGFAWWFSSMSSRMVGINSIKALAMSRIFWAKTASRDILCFFWYVEEPSSLSIVCFGIIMPELWVLIRVGGEHLGIGKSTPSN